MIDRTQRPVKNHPPARPVPKQSPPPANDFWSKLNDPALAEGIDEFYPYDPPRQEHVQEWQALCQRHPELRRHSARPACELTPPDPLSERDLRRLLGSLMHPEHRPLLRAVLVEVLADDIADLAINLLREVRRR